MSPEELSGTPMVGVRLGSLRPRVEDACKRKGVEMSEFLRTAVERELLRSDPLEGFAVCLFATRSFEGLLSAAAEAGLLEGNFMKR
jgi:hypothetical protein